MLVPIKTASGELNISEHFLRRLVRLGRVPSYKLSPRTTRVDLIELRNLMRLVAQVRPQEEEG